MLAVLTLAVLAADPAPSKEPIRLAAPGLTLIDLDPKLKGFYTDHLAQQLRFQGVQVSTDTDIAAVLGLERQRQLLGCSDDVCKAEIGAALGVDGIVLGTVTRLDKSFKMDLRIVAAGTAQVLATASTSTGDSDQLVGTIVVVAESLAHQVATKLGKSLDPKGATQIVRGPTLAKRYAWVPAAVGVVVLAGGAAEYAMAKGNFDKLSNPQSPLLTQAQADAVAAEGRQQQNVAFIGLGIGAAAVVAGAAMYLFGGDELITTGVAILPGQVSVGVTGVF
jgi:hypothetical protein